MLQDEKDTDDDSGGGTGATAIVIVLILIIFAAVGGYLYLRWKKNREGNLLEFSDNRSEFNLKSQR